ncbi:hypothetical protein KUCAC02_029203 [Chaenocephalus aceratus]|uniref:Uncharacterized protein n=1 Tax=Chaenocephalus aceratus TaxID=36190 RepID=A0ACB9X5Z4_CHAAC|nr:hypothetical protein KUCAC02_029203 [Chaenocephalus aceratus]
MSCGDETAAHISAHRLLCLQSCIDKAPSSSGWGMIEEDQDTVVGLVNTAVMDCWPKVSDLASELDPAPPAKEIKRRGESKPALPAITAGKIIKQKVFPVSVPSGKVLLHPLLRVYCGLDGG